MALRISWPSAFVVPPSKITHYLLNPESRDGAGKEKFFRAHGFSRLLPGTLSDALVAHTSLQNFEGIRVVPWGHTLIFEGVLATPLGTEPRILTVWQVSSVGNGEARLITAYPA